MLRLPVLRQFISRVFIPTLVNAAASAGDFMVIYFNLKHSRQTHDRDVGDIITTLEETSSPKPSVG